MVIERYFQNAGVTYGYDATQTELIAAAVAAGWTEVTDSWPPAPPTPTLAQQAASASVSGLTITLTGRITLAATLFPTDPATQAKLSAVVTTLIATGTFPDGMTSYPIKDASGTWHSFTDAEYKAVAGSIAAYVAALDMIADGNPFGATSLPSSTISITV